MNKPEDKELLLKDLCARLPYKVHCRVFKLNEDIKENDDILYGVVGDNVVTLKSDKDECLMYYQIKPYLRPMNSIRKDEKEFILRCGYGGNHIPHKEINFYLSHHLDFHGLIPMGLALEAPKDMYK